MTSYKVKPKHTNTYLVFVCTARSCILNIGSYNLLWFIGCYNIMFIRLSHWPIRMHINKPTSSLNQWEKSWLWIIWVGSQNLKLICLLLMIQIYILSENDHLVCFKQYLIFRVILRMTTSAVSAQCVTALGWYTMVPGVTVIPQCYPQNWWSSTKQEMMLLSWYRGSHLISKYNVWMIMVIYWKVCSFNELFK